MIETVINKNTIEVVKPIRINVVEAQVPGPQGPLGMTGPIGATGPGPTIVPVTITATNYNIQTTDAAIFVTASCTLTLPLTAGLTGKIYYITSNTSGMVTINTPGDVYIAGSLTLNINNQYSSVILITDGNNWYIL